MPAITFISYMKREHEQCDALFDACVRFADRREPVNAAQAYEAFRSAMEAHLRAEEEVVFPVFERATGITSGPTVVMRRDHELMRESLCRMADAVTESALDAFLAEAETLQILHGQHNLKEEAMLYPMIERALGQELLETLLGILRREHSQEAVG